MAPRHLREAELALASATRDGRSTVFFERIGLLDWLIAGRDAESARDKANEMLAPVLDHPALLRTLASYVHCDCNIQRTAHALGLHPNSVRYRLSRASGITGLDLSSPGNLAELALSIRLLGA